MVPLLFLIWAFISQTPVIDALLVSLAISGTLPLCRCLSLSLSLSLPLSPLGCLIPFHFSLCTLYATDLIGQCILRVKKRMSCNAMTPSDEPTRWKGRVGSPVATQHPFCAIFANSPARTES